MIASLKAELRKLLTVRSTYVIILISLAIIALFAGYGDGYKATALNLRDPNWLAHESYSAIIFAGLIVALTGLLLFGHEYRYNGIMYTLTSSNNRLKSLLAKGLITTLFAVVVSVVFTFFSPLCSIIGVHIAGHTFGPQTFAVWQVLWHCMFVGWGYAMYAFVLVAIIRSQVGSIVAFLLIPLIGENILANVFRGIAKYLPFMSLQGVTPTGPTQVIASLHHNVYVSLTYIVVGLLVSSVLFLRRDAN
jgi:ABC-type transport system involved in multi-copper enzyme maturation permease subunit